MGSRLPNHDVKGWKEWKKNQKKTKKTKGKLHQTGLERNHNKKSIYMMHELNEQMMHALMH